MSSGTVPQRAVTRSGRFARIGCEWCLFVSLAIASTYPLVTSITTDIPLSHAGEPLATVPLLNLWTIWWNVDRIQHGYSGYWDAPIYCPERGFFAASEPQTVVGWIAWPLWRFMPDAATVYNLLVLLFLTLNGWTASRLLQSLRVAWLFALCGGAMIILLPLVHWQLGVFQLISLWGIIWTLHAVLQFRHGPGPWRAAHIAVAFAVTYSLCCYYGLFLSVLLLACAGTLFTRHMFQLRFWGWAGLATACTFAVLSPVVTAQLSFARQHPFRYPDQWVRTLSAVPTDYLRTPWSQLVSVPDGLWNEGAYPWPLSPGTLKICMAVAGVAWGMKTRCRRRPTVFLGSVAIVALLCSMGPRLSWGGLSLYRCLVDHYPGFANVRSLYRFAYFVQIALALLAAIGLHQTFAWLMRRPWPRRRRIVAYAASLVLGVLLVGEVWPAKPSLYRLPEASVNGSWIDYLRNDPSPRVKLVFLPLPETYTTRALQPTAEWMYFQTLHAKPMVNGYSTIVPKTFQELKKALHNFPDLQSVAVLQACGVSHVVLDERAGPPADAESMEAMGMVRVVADQHAHMEIWLVPQQP